MRVSMRIHAQFEEALYDAFPRLPLPALDAMTVSSALEGHAKEMFGGTPWPEVVGYRLISGEMDLSPSIWMDAMPAEVFDYYVPSLLMLASILLGCGELAGYPTKLMEAFLLPPKEEEGNDAVAQLDDELGPDAIVSIYGSVRLSFYRRITAPQRACIGRFLDLYLGYRREVGFHEESVRMFVRNRDYWLHSSR